MSQSWPGPGPAEPHTALEEIDLKKSAIIAYVLMLAACLVGITAIIAVILAYVRRVDSAGTVWHSHFRNVTSVFWTIFAAALIGLATFPVALGAYLSGGGGWPPLPAFVLPVLVWVVGFPIVAVWFLYRMVRGLVRASDGRPY
jgi:uncharacterized membrane protein